MPSSTSATDASAARCFSRSLLIRTIIPARPADRRAGPRSGRDRRDRVRVIGSGMGSTGAGGSVSGVSGSSSPGSSGTGSVGSIGG